MVRPYFPLSIVVILLIFQNRITSFKLNVVSRRPFAWEIMLP